MNDVIAQLVEVGRAAVERGLVLASGGNLSARLPGGTQFAVTGEELELVVAMVKRALLEGPRQEQAAAVA